MRIAYCDGYYFEDGAYYRHDEATGLDVVVHEDEARAHIPSMYLDDYPYNHPMYKKAKENSEKKDEDVVDRLIARFNQYRDYIDVLEELLAEAKADSNTLAEITFNDAIFRFKDAQAVILKRLGITF